jgi:hypothetical protein
MPVHDRTAGASIVLMPAVSPQTSEVPAVNLPKGDQDMVRLQLVLKSDYEGPYRAEVLTIEGASVFSTEALNLTDARAEIDFDVPARLFKTGKYQVKLRGSDGGSQKNVVNYYFRVQ